MKLLLDVGNTAVKWALAEAGRPGANGYFEHRGGRFGELAATAWSALPAPAAVAVASVAGPDMAAEISRYVQAVWQLEPVFAQAVSSACGVTNAYERPGDLGVDRWVAMIAAHRTSAGAVCVIDCGTAITLDLLAGSGRHRGGLILPGVELLRRTLQGNTAGIELQDGAQSAMLLARGTQAGVTGGARYLAAAAIDRIVTDMGEAAAEPLTTVVTGGDAERLLPLLTVPVRHEPALVLQGLAILSDGEG